MSSNTEQSFLSKDAPPVFLRVIQSLILGFIAMVVGQLTRVNRLDLSAMLLFVIAMLMIIFAATLQEKADSQQ